MKSRLSSIEVILLTENYNKELAPYRDQLIQIVGQCYSFPFSMDTFIDKIIYRGENTQFLIYRNDLGVIGGFSCLKPIQYNIQGKAVFVYKSAMFIDENFTSGNLAAKHGLIDALKLKLRQPMKKIYFLTEASTPAAYCHLAKSFSSYYPNPSQEIPSLLKDIGLEISKKDGYESLNDSFVAKLKYTRQLKNPERIERSKKINTTKNFRYYMELNPGYKNGEEVILFFSPISLFNTISSIIKILGTKLRA